jgi:hypothetical protein
MTNGRLRHVVVGTAGCSAVTKISIKYVYGPSHLERYLSVLLFEKGRRINHGYTKDVITAIIFCTVVIS